MSQEPQKNNILIIVAIIGVIGGVIAATINVIGNYNVAKMNQEIQLTQIALAVNATHGNPTQAPTGNIISQLNPPTPQSTLAQSNIALSDNFDETSDSYDTSLWACFSECNAENLFLQDGLLNLKRNSNGVTDIVSRSAWDYDKIASLSGKIQISKNLYQGGESWTWVSLHYLTDCTLSGSESPHITCAVGTPGDQKYLTNEIPVNFDTWYSIKIDFDHNINTLKFYLDNEQIGQYVFTETPDTAQVSLGMYSSVSSQTYVDDVLLTLTK